MAEIRRPFPNIYVIGAQCTGKTTLVNALEASSGILSGGEQAPIIIREVARTVLKDRGFSRDDITSSPSRALELQRYILEAQLAAEENAAKDASSTWYISDRSGLDPIVYARLYVGLAEAEAMLASDTWKALEERMKRGIVLLCEAGCSWLVDDGTRLMPTNLGDWTRVHNAFKTLLEERSIRFETIPKDLIGLTERIGIVKRVFESTASLTAQKTASLAS